MLLLVVVHKMITLRQHRFFEEGGGRLSSSLLDMKFTLFLFVILNLEGGASYFCHSLEGKTLKKTPKPCYPKDINISSK